MGGILDHRVLDMPALPYVAEGVCVRERIKSGEGCVLWVKATHHFSILRDIQYYGVGPGHTFWGDFTLHPRG